MASWQAGQEWLRDWFAGCLVGRLAGWLVWQAVAVAAATAAAAGDGVPAPAATAACRRVKPENLLQTFFALGVFCDLL